MRWLHYYNRLLTAAAFLVITAGGLVTSTASGLAVPDWPNTYGYFMFFFPLSKMVGGILYEHGHRLIASIVGLLTIGLTILLLVLESRRWVKRLGWLALATVTGQGILGGLTVLYFLPTMISVSHAGLAQLFFILVVSLTVFTSEGWQLGYRRGVIDRTTITNDTTLCRLTVCTPFVIYLQIMIGATMRHTGAGLAIPDFPLAFGHVFPPMWTAAIALHFGHRLGAIVVTVLVLATASHVLAHHRIRPELIRPALLLIMVVIVQFTLGAWTVLSERHIVVNTAHVAVGALLFVASGVLGLRVHRDRFPDALREAGSSATETTTSGDLTPRTMPGASGVSH